MIGTGIAFFVRNLLVRAIVVAALRATRGDTWPERWLGWLLLLPFGVTGLRAGIPHVFFPHVAAE